MPKLSYQTAVISLTQFIIIMFLGVPNAIIDIVTTCHNSGSDCVSNMIVTIVFYLLTGAWFGAIVLLGYGAQKKRSRQLAIILIGFEFITLVVAGYIDFPHDSNLLAKMTSLLDGGLSIWVIYLASRLLLSGGKRIVRKPSVIKRVKAKH